MRQAYVGSPWREAIRDCQPISPWMVAVEPLLKLLSLPVYGRVLGINLFVFLGLNGYGFGRGLFEVVALKRLRAIARRGRIRVATGYPASSQMGCGIHVWPEETRYGGS